VERGGTGKDGVEIVWREGGERLVGVVSRSEEDDGRGRGG